MVESEAEGKRRVRETLSANGITVDRIDRIAPSLEDVFLFLLEQGPAAAGRST